MFRQLQSIGFAFLVATCVVLLASPNEAQAQVACPTTTLGGDGATGDGAMPGIFTADANTCNASSGSILTFEYNDLANQCARQARFVGINPTSDAMCLALPREGDIDGDATHGMRVAFAEGTTQTAVNVDSMSCPGATSVTGAGTTLGEVILADGASCTLTITAPANSGGTFGFSGSTLSRVGANYFLTAGSISGGAYGGAAPGTSPALAVTGNSLAIASGDTTPIAGDGTVFGSANIGGTAATQTFAIANSGTGQLTISSITFSGDAASEFSVSSAPATNTAPSGGTTNFTVSFAPTAAGTRNAVVEINSNDPTNDPYTFAIQGTGVDVTDPTVSLTRAVTGDPTNVQTISVTATFSEAVTGFEASDLVLSSNASLSNFNDGANPVFTFDVTANSDGAITVDVPANVATDAASNGNTAATELGWTYDSQGPAVSISGPSGVQSANFSITITASDTTDVLTAGDLVASNAVLSGFDDSAAPASYTVTVEPTFGQTVTVALPANTLRDATSNGNLEASYVASTGNAMSEFQANEAELQNALQSDTRRVLSNEMSTNTAMMDRALDRFIDRGEQSGGVVSQNDLSGFLQSNVQGFSSAIEGSFQESAASSNRYAFGDVSLVRDQDGSVTGQASARVSWEFAQSDALTLGYFVGASIGRSDIRGTIEGEVDNVGLTGGGYALNRIAENLYATAYVGFGRNWSEFSGSTTSTGGSGTTSFSADYDSFSYFAGLDVAGSHVMQGFEVRPALSLDFGKTDVGVVGFNTIGFGTTAFATSDLGHVSIADLTASTKVIVPIALTSSIDAKLNVEPSAMCRRQSGSSQTSQTCGFGLSVGLEASNRSGSLNYGLNLGYAETGVSQRSSLAANLSLAF